MSALARNKSGSNPLWAFVPAPLPAKQSLLYSIRKAFPKDKGIVTKTADGRFLTQRSK